MAKLHLTLVTAASLALSGAVLLGCPSTRNKESAGEYVDDSVITAKVKSAIMGEMSLKSLGINVSTFKDTVQLSGFVDSAGSAQRAGQLASAVQGVSSVRNDLIVK